MVLDLMKASSLIERRMIGGFKIDMVRYNTKFLKFTYHVYDSEFIQKWNVAVTPYNPMQLLLK